MPFVRSPSVLSYHDDIEFMAGTMAGDGAIQVSGNWSITSLGLDTERRMSSIGLSIQTMGFSVSRRAK
jgi:hypothetical protein